MTVEISERRFEDEIERVLLRYGPDDASPMVIRDSPMPASGFRPGGYRRRTTKSCDPALCLLPDDVIDFVMATQAKEWNRLRQHHGEAVREQFLKRLAAEIDRRGALDVLRNGIKDSGCKFRLAYFRPASGLNPETRRLHAANLFSVVRQLFFHPSQPGAKDGPSLDLVLFLNGIPIFTAELKNPLSAQDIEDAMQQYKRRDVREPLFAYGRCLAHFAVDPELVYVTTHLQGATTRFLPFNQGRFGGAGNPPVPPTRSGYATSYLWEETWCRDSALDLIRQFIHEIEEEDEKGKKTGRRFLIFPRYQQLDAVRMLVRDARERGAGQRYLVQHSAGSGKSFTIGWLAHHLSTLHDSNESRVFDSIIVITDRRVLDRQLQTTMRQLEQTLGVVENIDKTSSQLKDALEAGKTIIVTTLQKFPVIAREIADLPGKRFAVIVDEAHSSQSGEKSTQPMKDVLRAKSLEEAEKEEEPERDEEDRINEIAAGHRWPKNTSLFAFTATPKPKTLELFGRKRSDGQFEPHHKYSMRQAIEEGFILDVLANCTTYTAYWRLLKKIESDPKYDKKKAKSLLKSFVEVNPHAIGEKVRIMVEHFASQVQNEISGRAKAMIVTRSRLHAVRYKLAIHDYLAKQKYPFKALVAFSGTVEDGERSYTEANMNGFPESQTAKAFERAENRFLIVANKFQTGFDQPLLHTMYVDKKLGGVNAVQTLSRLNRTHADKKGTMVLDFANDAAEIKKAFDPYYETTLLSEATDPNLLYEVQGRLAAFAVYTQDDVDRFAKIYFDPKSTQDRVHSALAPAAQRFSELQGESEKSDFRSQLADFVRLYSFLSQILTFADADLEKLYAFSRNLRRLLPADRESLPREVQQNIDMESYRLQQTASGRITLDRRPGILDPIATKGRQAAAPEELEVLSRIIAELNERFGLNLGPEHRVTLEQMMDRLDADPGLDASARVNTRENVRLTFDQKVEHVIQDIVDSNFELYKRITDDRAFGEAIKNLLFDQYLRTHRDADELIKRGESKTLEFKSTLRWNMKEDKQDDRIVAHAVLKTIAAFLNTEGGDLLIGVADDRSIVGIEKDRFESDDKFMLHLAQIVRNALGDRAGTCIDPKTQIVDGKTVCIVSCQRSPEPVYLRWKSVESSRDGDFFVRSGPSSVKLQAESAAEYVRTRFPAWSAAARQSSE
jgi:type I restriction enzyme R subunit